MIKCKQSSVFIGEEAWTEFERLLEEFRSSGKKIYVLADENTAQLCVQRLQSVHGVISENLLVIEPGEASKNLEIVYQLWSELLESGADRKSVLINIGGGVITDLGGFVASTFKRGIPFINIPTSLMAMADAGIGGKTGIDIGAAKNQVGTFAWPESILIMPELLESLPEVEMKSGYVECLKHGLLTSQELFNQLLSAHPPDLTTEILSEIVKVKVDVVNEDSLETGIRKSLNLGHTVGHAIESSLLEQNTPLAHGNAVLLGLIAELKMAELHLGLDPRVLSQLAKFADTNYPELKNLKFDLPRVDHYMLLDKKNEMGNVRFALLSEIGNCKVDVVLPHDTIHSGLNHLRSWLGQ